MKIRTAIWIMTILFLCLPMKAQKNGVRRCTESELPTSARREYISQVRSYLVDYYGHLLFGVGEEMIKEAFVDTYMQRDTTRYKPEFLFTINNSNDFLPPDQYLNELDKQFFSYDTDRLHLRADNFSINSEDFFLPTLISCYVIAEYDLTLLHDDRILYKRRCRAYCLFPRLAVSFNVLLMQVEPVRDIIAYTPPVQNPAMDNLQVADDDAVCNQAFEYYDEKKYDLSFPIFERLAEKGFPRAINALGLCYRHGHGVDEDKVKAVSLFRQAGDKGYLRGYTNLADCYLKGEGVPLDKRASFDLYKNTAEMGDTVAQTQMGIYYIEGNEFVKTNFKKAAEWCRKAADQGYDHAECLLGQCYLLGKGVPKDREIAEKLFLRSVSDGWNITRNHLGNFYIDEKRYDEAFRWYKLAAEDNDDEGIANVAYCYEFGYGVKLDYAKALEIYAGPAERGFDWAQYRLGVMYYEGKGVDKDYSKAVDYFRMAAEQGHPEAQNSLANCYLNREGISDPKTVADKEAYYWYCKSALQDNSTGISMVGYCYHWGKGVARDTKKAKLYYEKAVELGDTYAMCQIGVMYKRGDGVRQSDKKAVKWFKRAALLNDARANYLLANMYEDGKGVPQNDDTALHFYRKAERLGDEGARSAIEYLEKKKAK